MGEDASEKANRKVWIRFLPVKRISVKRMSRSVYEVDVVGIKYK